MDQNSPPPPPPPAKSAIPRRGPPLTAIRTDLAQQQQSQPPPQQHQQQHQQRTRPVLQKPRPQRLRPTEVVANQPPSVPLQSGPTRKVASKTSLRGLFARNKALREERKTETTLLPAVGERRGSTTPSTTVPDTPRSIAHTLASGSTLHASSSQVATPTESTFTLDRPSRGARVKPEQKSKVSSSWTPPPLFQAYPQASKYARLAVPNIAPDTILRIHATQAGSFRNPFQPGEAEGGDAEAAKKGKKDAKDKKHVKRGGANSLDQIVFLKKIFVLVTAGYLLQYSGEGSYDRLPEKIMRLGPASAAFASDSIPGKHHVVQISQKSTDDGTAPAAAGRTFLSRFGLQTAESRRAVRTYLVIMSSAQEMNSWLIALRKTIESLGGKKYVPELAPGDDSEAPEVPSNTLLSHRGSRLLASRKSSLRESNPPSPLSDTFPMPPSATSTHRKSFYQEEEQEQQIQQPPRIPSPVKTSNRLSISGPLDIVTIPSTTSTFGDSDIIFENPRDAPLPTPPSKITPDSPPPLPPAVETPAQSPAITPRLRKPSSTSSNTNRRSLTSYTATQLERQGEIARASRPLSFIGNGPAAAPSLPLQNTGLPGPNVRLSLLRGYSSRSLLSDESTTRRTPTTETAPKLPSRTAETPTSNIGTKRDSILNTQKRQSLISSSRSATPTSSSAIATARTIPTIPPRKYSLSRTESSESVTPAAGTARYYQQNKLPDMNHTPRLPQQRPSQLTQSRLPSVTEKGRPSTRLPKINSDSPESTTPTSTPPPSNLARFALGKDRANRVSASTSKARESPSRSTPALSHQQPRQPTIAPVSDDQPGPQSRTTTPASSPQTPQTPREESSRRSSIITSQPQSQQTSPRARRNPNLSFLPPAPPPNVPLPEAPPPNIAFRHIPLWQKRHLQQPSHPPQSQLPQPPPASQQTQQQTHLPRPSISSSSLTSAASSPAPPAASSSAATNQQHPRRRSSELRSLHLQMANMLNNSIMHRKQSDVTLAGTTTTTTTATNTANATPTSEFPPPLNMNMNLNPYPQRRSQSPQKRNDQ